jgi:sterol desaturase/sphingolipid hydroxylase (fatty acid hydroxylase superfamily)
MVNRRSIRAYPNGIVARPRGMNVLATLPTLGAILGVMGVLAIAETIIPLHARGRWHRAHLRPNLTLTLLTFASNVFLNAALVVLLLWLEARGFGLLRWLALGPIAAAIAGVMALDFAWYVLHRSMHRVPALWKIHRVHHSDPVVDVTTSIRQHPAESLLRYATLALTVAVLGVGLAAFTVYRVWSALNGLAEHTNVRLPARLDRTLALVTVSPDMHKVHHSRDARETDTNYGNILSIFDHALGTYTPAERGRTVTCGLDGFDAPADQTTAGLLTMPFRDRVPSETAHASS